ncbi:hypothetical protein ACRALDRAFT_210645 [Sodiomyces alcalophilus JCM 7366]|uniref:uncharacterized protein n=1 Tax=Sodiomyces alcalophilus JCM 7366 TaxID=591952 RepID=UPI0039B521A7
MILYNPKPHDIQGQRTPTKPRPNPDQLELGGQLKFHFLTPFQNEILTEILVVPLISWILKFPRYA